MVFDVSKQSERLNSSVVDIQIKATSNKIVLTGTDAFAVIISDKLLTFRWPENERGVLNAANVRN